MKTPILADNVEIKKEFCVEKDFSLCDIEEIKQK